MNTHGQNPYEPPREQSFAEVPTDIETLERRIAELEKQVAQSWFVRPNTFTRMLAVWGYFLLGYGILLAIALPFALAMFLIDAWIYGGTR